MALVALSGCGAPTSSSTSSSAAALTLLPSADAFHSAVVATRALGTARIVVDVTRVAQTGNQTLTAGGVSVIGSGMGDLQWTTPDQSYRELVNNKGIFVTSTGAEWTQWTLDEPTPTSGFVDPLRGLGVLREVTITGREDLGPVSTLRYTGWLPVDADEAAQLGLAEGDIPTLGDRPREDVSVWIDDFGHVVRVDRAVKDTEGRPRLTSSTAMTEFSMLLDLTSPSRNVTLGARPLP
jgi:hypothetical protein